MMRTCRSSLRQRKDSNLNENDSSWGRRSHDSRNIFLTQILNPESFKHHSRFIPYNIPSDDARMTQKSLK